MSTEPGTAFRRIVTGHDADNRAVIVSAEPPTRVYDNLGEKGLVFYEVWNTRETPARIGRDDAEPAEDKLMLAPPERGTRIRVLDIPPDKAETDFSAVFDNIGGGDAHISDGSTRHASFHRTRSIDYGIILSGEIAMLVDDGEVTVSAGDIVVQRGTNHGWVNRSDKPCRIAFILIDAVFEDGIA
ncbi:MAG: cupin [Novosphingobium lindaniclasticum]|jgi:mannose-6-phosphate isomerase-like protein (cupin superfamily)|uniref:cupin domain-containing protein n=1 Tax=Novosphingobium lindaniclasticum TaxID=1329895 RepID=UPI002409E258|nr:cupin domain-containing protein [Novosphingobium lindaniclasticum]MDF2640361.1 cupin [Novosphingobium lindaniclasticum]